MNNAEKFQQVFGIYSEEFWSIPEKEMLKWINDEYVDKLWIPVTERLPEEGQSILATVTDNAWGDVVILRKYYKEMHKSVIAWMPLPEPYKGET